MSKEHDPGRIAPLGTRVSRPAPPSPPLAPPLAPPVSLPASTPPQPSGAVPGVAPDADQKKKKKKDRKKDRTGSARGIETMFRTSYRTHIDMSGLADNKANIMISINGLIMSIIIASISSRIDSNPWLTVPTIILLLGCLVSMVFAVLAARPRVSSNLLTLDEVRQNRANILFFGNFVNLREDDFLQGMQELLHNPDVLYSSMIRDIYSLGGVLARKFRLLRVSYNVFMGGLVVGVISFIIVLAWVALSGPVTIAGLAPLP
ncbi:MAG: DUF5706 domain-containing protein [Gemmatimonadetes bacterium]|nr:DUF5706 domain-containing protein [Gemmatimonadota bacterium]